MIEILDAVLEALRTGPKAFSAPVLDSKTSDVEPDGSPPPRAGNFYISVMENGTRSVGDAAQFALEEVHRVVVFVSIRIAATPQDRYDVILRRNTKGMKVLERQVLRAVHGQQWIRSRANAIALAAGNMGVGDQGYLTPLYFEGRSQYAVRGADWSSETNSSLGWVVAQLPFVGMRRIQYLDSIT